MRARAALAFAVGLCLSAGSVTSCGGSSSADATPVPTVALATSTASTSTVSRHSVEDVGPSSTEPKSDSPKVERRATDAGDYEGQLYDFGAITEVRRAGSSVELIFNRQQLYTDGGKLKSGSQFTQEPIVYGNTDVPYVDDSAKTRRFVMAPDAQVLRIADPIPCASDQIIADPVWVNTGVDQLVAGNWKNRLEDTLSFRSDGLVDQVRLSSGC